MTGRLYGKTDSLYGKLDNTGKLTAVSMGKLTDSLQGMSDSSLFEKTDNYGINDSLSMGKQTDSLDKKTARQPLWENRQRVYGKTDTQPLLESLKAVST